MLLQQSARPVINSFPSILVVLIDREDALSTSNIDGKCTFWATTGSVVNVSSISTPTMPTSIMWHLPSTTCPTSFQFQRHLHYHYQILDSGVKGCVVQCWAWQEPFSTFLLFDSIVSAKTILHISGKTVCNTSPDNVKKLNILKLWLKSNLYLFHLSFHIIVRCSCC